MVAIAGRTEISFMNRLITIACLILLFTGCTGSWGDRVVKIKLHTENSGWYFIEIARDTTMKDTGTTVIDFDDTTKLLSVKMNHVDKTILSPVDYNGHSLSNRLKYLGFLEAKGKQFFEFYNPTEEELANIHKWMPSNERAWKIRLDEDKEFEKY